jgi:hypothetical protein
MATSEIMPWAFPRKVFRGERLANHDYRSTRRVLEQIAVRTGRARGGGRPILWRLRNLLRRATQKLEQLEARMDEIADRIAHERTGAARERTSTHEAQRPSH